jgi:hypothetical protein
MASLPCLALRLVPELTLGDLLVGVGTLALAALTYGLGRAARAEGSQVAAQVAVERERLELEGRPYVVPAPNPDWTHRSGGGAYASGRWRAFLPVKNVGPGAALNVAGVLDFGDPSGVTVDLVPTSIAPGEREDLRVHWDAPERDDWQKVDGRLIFEDIGGARFQTSFTLVDRNDVRYIDVKPMTVIDEGLDRSAA